MHNANKNPVFGAANWAALGHFNAITKTAFVFLIVHMKNGSLLHILSILWMLGHKVHNNGAGLEALIAFNNTNAAWTFQRNGNGCGLMTLDFTSACLTLRGAFTLVVDGLVVVEPKRAISDADLLLPVPVPAFALV